MDVQIVMLPETKVAAIGHHGSPEHETAGKLIARKLERKLPDAAAAFVPIFLPSSLVLTERASAACLRLNVAAQRQRHIHINPNPKIALTAARNGCSTNAI